MASRKLVRDLFLSRQPLFLHLTSKQVSGRRLQVLSNHGHTYYGYRRFSVFNEFSKKVKGEADRNQEFKQSVKELKEKTEELKGAKEELKVRTKQTTEQLYKHVDGVWTEAEATAKKRALKSTYWSDRWIVGLFSDVSELENLAVSANVKEKISAATEEVKETFGIGKESSESAGTSAKDGAGAEEGTKASPGEEADKQTGTGDTEESFFGKFKSRIPSSNVSSAYQKLKEARVSEMMKKGYDVVKDELYGNTNKRKHLEHTPPPAFSGEISTKTDIVALPSKQSRWSKKWEAFREKMQGHPLFKRFAGLSEPVVTKGQEIAEDMRERWETSDSPIVIKIQDVSDSIFQESDAAASFKEIRRKDPSFSLMDFVAEVQEAVRPVLNAYIKGDIETLKKYCTPEVINRCEAEHKAFQAHGIFFDNKILHITDVEVRETKMMGTSPIIIVVFQTQQVHCIRDRHGAITEGGQNIDPQFGHELSMRVHDPTTSYERHRNTHPARSSSVIIQDTIHTVYYAWAMRQVDAEELGGGAIYPIWKLMEMQQLGVQTLI
ncbi:hypothetical protein POTOM_007380 [Populus tomentosa]|uniref:Tim44-like domain-containing protein n=1 Tax=Populus tomentosa TaxID=118781 RepID=A0A8X8D395_POPTO|nr:hypothetical protein POTOM_007380 [Populus tomentosa]